MSDHRPDVVILLTDQERAIPVYEGDEIGRWRDRVLTGRRWFDEHGVTFERHMTGSLACAPSRPTIFTGQYPDVHGVTQTDGIGKTADDSRMRWLPPNDVPTLGHWFRAAGYDTHYDGKWHISHAELTDPSTGGALLTNDDDGLVDDAAVAAYRDADLLDEHGFSGWIGPEPHGPLLANSGLRRDPLVAERVVTWLDDRHARRRAGDLDAQRPFLLVASLTNPHDIVFHPVWSRFGSPLEPGPLDPPPLGPSPTDDEDLSTKPAAQAAYRRAYPTGYGPREDIERAYRDDAQAYRDLYLRLHAEGDEPLDRIRRAAIDSDDRDVVLVRTADHGELLGAHGGLHQKWFNLYDEAVRVPFTIVRTGADATSRHRIDAPTSHVDIVPTLLDAADIDRGSVEAELRDRFSEVHPLPGRSLWPVVTGAEEPDPDRAVYLMTRDSILEGDTGASIFARALGRTDPIPDELRIDMADDVATNFEALIATVSDGEAPGGRGHLWKIVRVFDDPEFWSDPGVRHRRNGAERTEPLADDWELYDLTADPIEAVNLAHSEAVQTVFNHLRQRLAEERTRALPTRNRPWAPDRVALIPSG